MPRLVNRILGALDHRRLKRAAGPEPFAIVSNNCWGAHVYQRLGLPYATPFVGLFMRPDCYLMLMGDFERLVRGRLRFVEASRYADVNEKRTTRGAHPIAVLADALELHFLHEKSEEHARDKWNRRVARIPEDPARRFYKFCDFDTPGEARLRAFDALPLPNKVTFVATPLPGARSAIVVPSATGRVPDGMALQTACLPHFDHAAWLRGRDPRPGAIARALTRPRA